MYYKKMAKTYFANKYCEKVYPSEILLKRTAVQTLNIIK